MNRFVLFLLLTIAFIGAYIYGRRTNFSISWPFHILLLLAGLVSLCDMHLSHSWQENMHFVIMPILSLCFVFVVVLLNKNKIALLGVFLLGCGGMIPHVESLSYGLYFYSITSVLLLVMLGYSVYIIWRKKPVTVPGVVFLLMNLLAGQYAPITQPFLPVLVVLPLWATVPDRKSIFQLISKSAEPIHNHQSAATATVDKLETLEALHELLDQGVITQEEYDVKKKRLLGL